MVIPSPFPHGRGRYLRPGPSYSEVKLGPFVGGINNISEASAVADNELVDSVNLELDLDGSMVVRPPIKEVTNPGGTTHVRMLYGVILNGLAYLIGASDTATYAFNGSSWTTITTTFGAVSVSQYKNKAYLIAPTTSANPGGSWDGTTYTALSGMPKGYASGIWKERMWIADGQFSSRLYFSNIANPDVWTTATDFFDISPGDGQQLRDLVIFNNSMLLFKANSVYALSYDTKPADATITRVSNTIGVSGQRCIAQRQNSIYVFHDGNVFEMVNYNFAQINIKVPFAYDGSAPSSRSDNIFLSFIGDRLIVRYYNRIYMYNIKTKAWTRWASDDPNSHNFGPMVQWPQVLTPDIIVRYYGGSSLATINKVFLIQDGYDNTTTEVVPISCSILTKNYDMSLPYKFKRLFFWGVDVLTNKNITGIATPVVFGYIPTWGDLLSYTWDQLNTWATPLTQSIAQTTNINATSGTLKRFLKFNKGLRFRQINFQIKLSTDGSLADGPTRLYSITLFMSNRETVTKAIS